MLSPKRAMRRCRASCAPSAARAHVPMRSRTTSSSQWPDDDLPRVAQTRDDVCELAVAVRGLVEVHEVHVDLGPRQVPTELGVKVQQRLAQGLEPGDPHLRGRERVHPRDDADAGIVALRVQAGAPDAVRALHDQWRRRSSPGWPPTRRGPPRSPSACCSTRAQRLLAVEVLAAGEEPQAKPVGQHGRISLVSSPRGRADGDDGRNRVYANVCPPVKPVCS